MDRIDGHTVMRPTIELDGQPMKEVVVLAVCLLTSAAGAQTNASPIAADNRVHAKPSSAVLPELQLQGIVPVMFATLVREAGLSGGVAISNQDCSHGPEGSILIAAGTSFDVALGQVAKSKAMAEGQLRDGVANLLPADGAPPLLQVRIRRFEWDRTTPVREVIDRLRQQPEVSEEATKLGLKEAPFEGSGMSAICLGHDCREKPKPVPAMETEEGATLLTVLNRIVQAHSGAVWSYSEYHHCDSNTLFSLDVLAE